MGYYKNSFKPSTPSESDELSNLRGWVIIAGLAFAVISLFTLGNTDVEEGLFGFLNAGLMIFVGTAASFLCDKHVIGRILFLLLVLTTMVGLIFSFVYKQSIEYLIFMLAGCIYCLGALWLLAQYHLSLD